MHQKRILEKHYSRWQEKQCIEKFADKSMDDFFDSERYFLERMEEPVASALDIGCASGHFLKLLQSYFGEVDYMGVDIVEGHVESARRFYPEARFVTANAIDLELEETFDLVNATGVFQHEPDMESLLGKMWGWSERYMLFDVKFAEIPDHVIDVSRSYTRGDAHNLYFNLFNYRKFIDLCRDLTGVQKIRVYGYFTGPNNRTTLPEPLTRVVSANLLLEKGSPIRAREDIPVELRADEDVQGVL